MKRVDANDAYALKYLGSKYAAGSRGLRQDWNKALELWARAAELGSSEAHNAIGDAYLQGLVHAALIIRLWRNHRQS